MRLLILAKRMGKSAPSEKLKVRHPSASAPRLLWDG
jgi:hypothetical protein